MSETAQTLLQHLIELRRRLVRIAIVWVLVFIGLFHWAGTLYSWLASPLLAALPPGGHMLATGPVDTFFAPMKVAFLATFILTLPHTLYQVWGFVAPGLYRHEKRLAIPLIVSSVLLFLIGMAFAYGLVLPVIFRFMQAATPVGVAMMPDMNAYLDFVLGLFLAFGAAFEVPVVVVILVRLGVVSVAQLASWRSYLIVAAFVIAAIVTPPDVVSQLLLAIPLCLLFEAGLLAARLITPKAG